MVEDKIIWDKELKDDSDSIATAITEYLVEKDKIRDISFCVFLVDHRTGTVRYISDLPHESALGMMNHWVKSNMQ